MIVQNAVSCLNCGDTIVSKHRHDYVQCTCGTIAVDGGQEYLRRVGDLSAAVDVSWSIADDIYNECADAVQWGLDNKRNKWGIANAVMRKLREKDCIIAEGEQRVMAYNPDLDEVMIVEADGSYNRYKKVID